mmetsp:Transcript_5845/g.15551  ORF Transcript_5845/g.15551 Transcript_5845/m.15551 type:complete len:259 (-) Transcript_5845:1376-2152(-)
MTRRWRRKRPTTSRHPRGGSLHWQAALQPGARPLASGLGEHASRGHPQLRSSSWTSPLKRCRPRQRQALQRDLQKPAGGLCRRSSRSLLGRPRRSRGPRASQPQRPGTSLPCRRQALQLGLRTLASGHWPRPWRRRPLRHGGQQTSLQPQRHGRPLPRRRQALQPDQQRPPSGHWPRPWPLWPGAQRRPPSLQRHGMPLPCRRQALQQGQQRLPSGHWLRPWRGQPLWLRGAWTAPPLRQPRNPASGLWPRVSRGRRR